MAKQSNKFPFIYSVHDLIFDFAFKNVLLTNLVEKH
jgi:hypothetical protein